MESVLSSAEDSLISKLDFNLANNKAASYLQDRSFVTYQCSGASQYSPSGNRVIRIPISAGQGSYLDPATFKVQFTVVNTQTTADANRVQYRLTPRVGPHGFIARMRLLSGSGTVLEDIGPEYGRTHEMFEMMQPKDVKLANLGEGFGWATKQSRSYIIATGDSIQYDAQRAIPPNSRKTVQFTPLLGLINQPKFLPLKLMQGLVLEMEIANADVPVITTAYNYYEKFPVTTILNVDDHNDNVQGHYLVNALEAGQNCHWLLESPCVKADCVMLSPDLESQFTAHLLSGRSLPISFQSFATMKQAITGPSAQFSLTRAATRLRTVFVTLMNDKTGAAWLSSKKGDVNTFWAPKGRNEVKDDVCDDFHTPSWQLQIGAKVWPVQRCGSYAETLVQLKKALGIHGSSVHGMALGGGKMFEGEKYVIGVDVEKSLEAIGTGISTKAGELLTVSLDNLTAETIGDPAVAYFGNVASASVVICYDSICLIKDSGVDLYD